MGEGMGKGRERLQRILPSYAYLPLLAAVGFNFLVYCGTRLINAGRLRHSMWTAADDRIPFVPFFVLFYVLAFAQWGIGYLLIGRESREVCWRFCLADVLAKAAAGICFLAYPTAILRPEVTGRGIFEMLTRLIYQVDAADNLFPSIHCLESWMCFRGALALKKVPRWYRPVTLAVTLLVFASTVLLKQHVLVDIPAGVLAAELGIWTSDRLRNRFTERKDNRLRR